MVEFKLTIGDPSSRKTYQKAISGDEASKLSGKKIGDTFHGETVGLTGYELKITGGSDTAGFPMRYDINSPGRAKILITKSTGFRHPKRAGQRKRITVRGNTISSDVAQINCKVIKAGKDQLAKLLGIEEKPAEAPKEAVVAEEKKPESTSKVSSKATAGKPAKEPKEEKN